MTLEDLYQIIHQLKQKYDGNTEILVNTSKDYDEHQIICLEAVERMNIIDNEINSEKLINIITD